MTSLSTSRNSRTTVLAIIALWLFGLVSGVANACLLEVSGEISAGHAKTLRAPGSATHTGPTGHFQIDAAFAEADHTNTSKQACLQVCDASSHSLPSKHTTDGIDPGLPGVMAVLWSSLSPAKLFTDRPSRSLHVVTNVPRRHRYARLAL